MSLHFQGIWQGDGLGRKLKGAVNDVNAGYSLVECLREMEERRAKHEE